MAVEQARRVVVACCCRHQLPALAAFYCFALPPPVMPFCYIRRRQRLLSSPSCCSSRSPMPARQPSSLFFLPPRIATCYAMPYILAAKLRRLCSALLRGCYMPLLVAASIAVKQARPRAPCHMPGSRRWRYYSCCCAFAQRAHT